MRGGQMLELLDHPRAAAIAPALPVGLDVAEDAFLGAAAAEVGHQAACVTVALRTVFPEVGERQRIQVTHRIEGPRPCEASFFLDESAGTARETPVVATARQEPDE